MARLDGRTAIVTGGAKGIGVHYSKALAAEGAQVMIADIADGSALAAEIAAKHGRNSTDSMVFDVSDEAQCKALVDKTITGVMKSGEINAIYAKWFTSPIPPKNINLNFPATPALKEAFTNPNDKGVS